MRVSIPLRAALAGTSVLAIALAIAISSASAAISRGAPRTHTVRMLGDASGGYRFEPAQLTVARGDTVAFLMQSGGPHNVAFQADRIPAGADKALAHVMPNQMSPLAGPLLVKEGERYVIALDTPPGQYEFFCMPHFGVGMKGSLTVQ